MKKDKLQLPVGLYHCHTNPGVHASLLGDLNIEIKFNSLSSYLPENLVKDKHLLGTTHPVHAIRTSQVYTDKKMQNALNLYCFNVQYFVHGVPVTYEELSAALMAADITKDWQEFSWGLLINYGQGRHLEVFLDWAKKDSTNLYLLSKKTKKYSKYELVFPEDTYGSLLSSFEDHLSTSSVELTEQEKQAIAHYVSAWKQFIADKSKRNQNIIY